MGKRLRNVPVGEVPAAAAEQPEHVFEKGAAVS
jgi:hypothetical protein